MWFNKEVFERFERFEQLSRRFNLMEIAVAEELQQQRNKVALIEKKVVELKWLERRVKTLDAQVDALMNREEEWKRRLAKIEMKLISSDMMKDGLIKEEVKEVEFEPRVGDLVVSRRNPTDIRKVLANGCGLQVVGIREINMYYREDLVKDFMSEWKVIARREDLK